MENIIPSLVTIFKSFPKLFFVVLCLIACNSNEKEPNILDIPQYTSCYLFALPRIDNIERHTSLTTNNFPYNNNSEYSKDRYFFYSPVPEDSVCIRYYCIIQDSMQMKKINALIQSCGPNKNQFYQNRSVKLVAFLFSSDSSFPDTLSISDELTLTLNSRYLQCTPLIVEYLKLLPKSLLRNWIESYDLSVDTATNDKNSVLLKINKIDTLSVFKSYF